MVLRCSRYTSRAGVRGFFSVSPPGCSAGSPTPQCAIHSSSVLLGVVGEEPADVDADAAGADDRDPLADRHDAGDRVGVGHHLRVVDAVERRGAAGSTPVATTTSSYAARSATVARRREPYVDAEHLEPPGVVAQRRGELLLAGDRHRQPELAADLGRGLEQRDVVAALGGRRPRRRGRPVRRRRRRRVVARRVGARTSVVSWQARGLTRQDARLLANVWSRQAWLQPMQVLISSARPAAALLTKSGSARNGRAIETRSAPPAARISSATSGVLIRLEAHTGMPSSGRSRAVVAAQAAARDLGDDRRAPGPRASRCRC